MSYPLQPNAPKVTVQGRTFAVGAFDWQTPLGAFYKIGVYEQMPDGGWNEVTGIATYANAGDVLADIQSKGGGVKFIQWLITAVNAFFTKLFESSASPPAPTSEPTTDTEARAYLVASVNALSFTVINGVPVLK